MAEFQHAFKVARMAEEALVEVKGLVGALPNLASNREGDEAQTDAAGTIGVGCVPVHTADLHAVDLTIILLLGERGVGGGARSDGLKSTD